MMLLAIDTSTIQMGLALYDGVHVIGEVLWRNRSRHTQELAPAFDELLTRTGYSIEAVKSIGVAIGPGSFTSLRVGLSFAKGLALARHIPLIGIPTLQIVAAAQPVREIPLAAVLPAGRKRLAVEWYRSGESGWQLTGSAQVMTAEELAESITTPTIVCGEMSADDQRRLERKWKNVLMTPPVQCTRRPAVLAALAWQRWQAEDVDDPSSLAPIYLHTDQSNLA